MEIKRVLQHALLGSVIVGGLVLHGLPVAAQGDPTAARGTTECRASQPADAPCRAEPFNTTASGSPTTGQTFSTSDDPNPAEPSTAATTPAQTTDGSAGDRGPIGENDPRTTSRSE